MVPGPHVNLLQYIKITSRWRSHLQCFLDPISSDVATMIGVLGPQNDELKKSGLRTPILLSQPELLIAVGLLLIWIVHVDSVHLVY